MTRSTAVGLLILLTAAVAVAQPGDAQWPTYGGDPGGQRYSTANQIDRSNVTHLHPAWIFHTHALDSHRPGSHSAAFETTPVLFHGSLYLTTPFDEIIALDPATGTQRWRYQPSLADLHEGDLITSRGVATWESSGTEPCAARIFVGTDDAQLIAVDAATGNPCAGFGKHGSVNLKAGLRGLAAKFHVTSTPTVLGDVVVVGSSIPDNAAVNMARGTVRAFDVRTGQQLWTWDPIPWADAQKIPTGAANTWSTIAADPALGLLYLPTGSASPDYFGGMRPGDNRDADSIVALDARTGRKVWAFQVVHHNLWDYDIASRATPLHLARQHSRRRSHHQDGNGLRPRPSHRRTALPRRRKARPAERHDRRSNLANSAILHAASTLPAHHADRRISPMARDAADQQFCREQMSGLRYDGIYTPPSLQGSLVFPGAIGGVNWGSAAYDPASGILYANTNRLPYFVQLIPQKPRPAHILARVRTSPTHSHDLPPGSSLPIHIAQTPEAPPNRKRPHPASAPRPSSSAYPSDTQTNKKSSYATAHKSRPPRP